MQQTLDMTTGVAYSENFRDPELRHLPIPACRGTVAGASSVHRPADHSRPAGDDQEGRRARRGFQVQDRGHRGHGLAAAACHRQELRRAAVGTDLVADRCAGRRLCLGRSRRHADHQRGLQCNAARPGSRGRDAAHGGSFERAAGHRGERHRGDPQGRRHREVQGQRAGDASLATRITTSGGFPTTATAASR